MRKKYLRQFKAIEMWATWEIFQNKNKFTQVKDRELFCW